MTGVTSKENPVTFPKALGKRKRRLRKQLREPADKAVAAKEPPIDVIVPSNSSCQ